MQRKGAFDHILLETTGLADPGPIASMFWQNEEFAMGLGRDIHLDGVVCVVDAVFGRKQMEEDHSDDGIGESLRQIAGSDVIILNKVDLVSPAEVEVTEEIIRKLNPAAAIHKTVRGEIDLKYIMGIDAYTSQPLLQQSHIHGEGHGHDHDHGTHAHEPTHYEIRGISSLQVDCPSLTTAQLDRLDEWIRSVLWENQLPGTNPAGEYAAPALQVLRCKGMFAVKDGKTYVLQGVRSLYEISKVAPGQEEDASVPVMGKVVFIGKGLDETVRRSIEAVLHT